MEQESTHDSMLRPKIEKKRGLELENKKRNGDMKEERGRGGKEKGSGEEVPLPSSLAPPSLPSLSLARGD